MARDMAILPEWWTHAPSMETQTMLTKENEASSWLFLRKFPHLAERKDTVLEHASIRIEDAAPTVNQINEFLSDAANIVSDEAGILKLVYNLMINLRKSEKGLSLAESTPIKYRYTNAFLLLGLEEEIPDLGHAIADDLEKLRVWRTSDAISDDEAKRSVERMAKETLAKLGSDGLSHIRASTKNHAIECMKVLSQEEARRIGASSKNP
jgi:hypothetical protein